MFATARVCRAGLGQGRAGGSRPGSASSLRRAAPAQLRGPARRPAVQAASLGGKERAAAPRPPPAQRTLVTFRVPGQEEPTTFERLTQAGLDAYLQLEGAKGFVNPATGNLSRLLEDLPEGGAVDLALPKELPLGTQVRARAWLACRPAGHRAGQLP